MLLWDGLPVQLAAGSLPSAPELALPSTQRASMCICLNRFYFNSEDLQLDLPTLRALHVAEVYEHHLS